MIFWQKANTDLIAKALSELTYEGLLNPTATSANNYELVLGSAKYEFSGQKTIWDMLMINEKSILRNGSEKISAAEFFIDAQKELNLTDIILSNFIEELNNSLFCEVGVLQKQAKTSAEAMTELSGEEIQTYLSGHPKLLVTKGRLGWGVQEFDLYGPENERPVQFMWIAVKRELAHFSIDSNLSEEDLLKESFNENELEKIYKKINDLKINKEDYLFLPVHPWQWNRFIKIQFYKDIVTSDIVELGVFGDHYLPQISVRSFYNNDRPNRVDIKLPISILNTSAVRGIASKYMDIGNKLSHYLQNLCLKDELLKNVEVLVERGGCAFVQSDFNKIAEGPYRYKEYLGTVWRDSSSSKIKNNEMAVMTGSLFHRDHEGKSFLMGLINKSKLTPEVWLSKYFQLVVVPLYHLQAKYGVGLVAHGQNIMLKMTDFIPSGLIIKDFQGDLRLSQDSILLSDEKFEEISLKLDKLPAHYLIHDLITGHLVTVLRFISSTLLVSTNFSEMKFYRLLANELETYIKNNPVDKSIDLLAPTFNRVLVNKVRFEIGYSDSNLRPRPAVGKDLVNPLFLALNEGRGNT